MSEPPPPSSPSTSPRSSPARSIAVDRVEAVAGAGLRGDRYFEPGADPERQLTLIESEELERLATEDGIALAPGESRRQLTTRGVRLNPLVGRRFMVGDGRVPRDRAVRAVQRPAEDGRATWA